MVSGASLVLQRLAEGMVERGHSVLGISSSDQQNHYSEYSNSLKIVRLRSFRNPLRVDQCVVLWSYDQITRELEQFQPDILHTDDPLNLDIAPVYVGRIDPDKKVDLVVRAAATVMQKKKPNYLS